jgi:metal-dependent amidase/aminoacylase/carboxypeptidase family protein
MSFIVARAQLKELEIPFKVYDKPVGARTGVLGTLGSGEPRFLLRADIDALPITVSSFRKVPCTCTTCIDTAEVHSWGERKTHHATQQCVLDFK